MSKSTAIFTSEALANVPSAPHLADEISRKPSTWMVSEVAHAPTALAGMKPGFRSSQGSDTTKHFTPAPQGEDAPAAAAKEPDSTPRTYRKGPRYQDLLLRMLMENPFLGSAREIASGITAQLFNRIGERRRESSFRALFTLPLTQKERVLCYSPVFMDWLFGLQAPLQTAVGYALSHATRLQLRFTSKPVKPDDQREKLSEVQGWITQQARCEWFDFGDIREEEGRLLLPVRFRLDGDITAHADFEIVDHAASFESASQFINAINLPLKTTKNDRYFGVLLQNRIFKDPSESAETVEHEMREVILRALGYTEEDAHRLAEEHQISEKPFVDYRTFPGPETPVQETYPGAAHQTRDPAGPTNHREREAA